MLGSTLDSHLQDFRCMYEYRYSYAGPFFLTFSLKHQRHNGCYSCVEDRKITIKYFLNSLFSWDFYTALSKGPKTTDLSYSLIAGRNHKTFTDPRKHAIGLFCNKWVYSTSSRIHEVMRSLRNLIRRLVTFILFVKVQSEDNCEPLVKAWFVFLHQHDRFKQLIYKHN